MFYCVLLQEFVVVAIDVACFSCIVSDDEPVFVYVHACVAWPFICTYAPKQPGCRLDFLRLIRMPPEYSRTWGEHISRLWTAVSVYSAMVFIVEFGAVGDVARVDGAPSLAWND